MIYFNKLWRQNLANIDPMSESLLVTVTAPASTSKVKVLELCNPTKIVELKYTGTLSFKWSFQWEECVFLLIQWAMLIGDADMNSSGNGRNAICYESQIPRFWLLSPKSLLVGSRPPQYRSWTTI